MSSIAFQGAVDTRDGPQPRRSSIDVVSWLTLYLIALLAIPSRLVVGPLGSAGAPSMLVGLMSFAFWVVLFLLRQRSAVTLGFHPMRWALSGFVLVSAISYALAMSRPINGDEVSPADVAMLALVSWAGTMLLAADGIRTRGRIEVLIWRVVMAGGILALLGIAQFVTELPLTDQFRIPGLTEVASPALFIRNGLVRPNGTATHPIEYGAILSMVLPLALYVLMRQSGRPSLLRWVPTLAIVAVVGLSGSRSAYLSALAGVLVCFLAWTPVVRRWVIGLGMSAIVVVSLVYPRLLRVIVGLFDDPEGDPSITSRTDSFDFAFAFLSDHPLFGRGFGTFLPKYRIFDNQYLVQLVSVGIVGTLALLSLAVVAMFEMRRTARAANGVEMVADRELAAALTGAVVAGFVSLLFFDAFAFPMTMGALFLILGIVGAVSRLGRDPEVL